MKEPKTLTLQVDWTKCAVAYSFLVSKQGLVTLLSKAVTGFWVSFITILNNSLFVNIFQSGRDKEEKWGFPVIIKKVYRNLEGRGKLVYIFGFD